MDGKGKFKMKKGIGFALLILMILLFAVSALADTWCVYTENGKPLNVRAKPSKNGKLVTTLRVGTEVNVTDIVGDGAWAHIKFGGRSGYCMLSYLRQGSVRFNEKQGYMVFYDAEAFTLTSEGETDAFMWNGNGGELPPCYLTISSISNMKAEDVMHGLLLQSGLDVDESDVYETELGGKDSLGFTYAPGINEGDRITQYVVCQTSKKNVLLVECGLYVGGEEEPGAYLRDMLDGIMFHTAASGSSSSTGSSKTSGSSHGGQSETEYVRCDICGGWFEPGNVFRNHLCVSYPSEDNMVRCDICGGWFESGNVFRNHLCVSYPTE